MTMPMALEKQGFLLDKSEEELYEIVDAAMSVAAWRNPEGFQNRRDQIAKNLFALPEDVIGLIYQNSHSTLESTTCSALTKDDNALQDPKTKAADSQTKSPAKCKLRIKPYKPNATNSKHGDEKKVDVKLVVPKTYGDNKNVEDQKLDASTVRSESVCSNVKKNIRNNEAVIDKKFEFSKRKLQETYKQLGERARKTKVIGFAEGKDLIEPTRDFKRSRLRR